MGSDPAMRNIAYGHEPKVGDVVASMDRSKVHGNMRYYEQGVICPLCKHSTHYTNYSEHCGVSICAACWADEDKFFSDRPACIL